MSSSTKHFSEYFKEHNHKFVVIGGQACAILHEDVGDDFGRITKDIDIVLIIGNIDADFFNHFQNYLVIHGYKCSKTEDGNNRYYRFTTASTDAPSIIELFSCAPTGFDLMQNAHLTPVVCTENKSLSAILLNTTYYEFVISHKSIIDNLPVASAECLVILKAKAWLDMKEREHTKTPAQSSDMRKHPRDIDRIINILPQTQFPESLPEEIANDLQSFLIHMENNRPDLSSTLRHYFRL